MRSLKLKEVGILHPRVLVTLEWGIVPWRAVNGISFKNRLFTWSFSSVIVDPSGEKLQTWQSIKLSNAYWNNWWGWGWGENHFNRVSDKVMSGSNRRQFCWAIQLCSQQMKGLTAEPLPPHLPPFTLLSHLCQHNFFLQQHCEAHHFRGKKQRKQNNDALLEPSRPPWSDLQHINNCSGRNSVGNVLWGQHRKKAERWAHFKLILTAQTHLMKSQLDNKWESHITRPQAFIERNSESIFNYRRTTMKFHYWKYLTKLIQYPLSKKT